MQGSEELNTLNMHDFHYILLQCGHYKWVSLLEYVCMDGRTLPAVGHFNRQMDSESPEDSIHGKRNFYKNGWNDTTTGLERVQGGFDNETKRLPERRIQNDSRGWPCSQITTAAMQYSMDQKIHLLCLPPYTMHILQQLDVSFFVFWRQP